jgi:hypothetical protein
MSGISPWLSIAGMIAVMVQLVNEVRGAVMAVPVLWAMYHAGGTWMAIWVGFCSLAGIAISVCAPWLAVRFVQRRWGTRPAL